MVFAVAAFVSPLLSVIVTVPSFLIITVLLSSSVYLTLPSDSFSTFFCSFDKSMVSPSEDVIIVFVSLAVSSSLSSSLPLASVLTTSPAELTFCSTFLFVPHAAKPTTIVLITTIDVIFFINSFLI